MITYLLSDITEVKKKGSQKYLCSSEIKRKKRQFRTLYLVTIFFKIAYEAKIFSNIRITRAA